MALKDWITPEQNLVDFISSQYETTIEVYKSDLTRIEEDLKKEIAIAEGGYGRKQVQELIQNAADALRNTKGRVQVILTEDHLYVANQGQPFAESGVRGLLYTHISDKEDDQIGRFGLGFKSISGISDAPQVFSQSVSFGFGKERTAEILSDEIDHPFAADDVPGLRLAWELNPSTEFEADSVLKELALWAVTIIKVPLTDEQDALSLSQEIQSFDETFCLFAPQVERLSFSDEIAGKNTYFEAKKRGDIVTIKANGATEEKWAVLEREHRPSDIALDSAGRAARRESVTVSWAVPLEKRLGVGQLAAYFPVMSEVTLSGRINAPWKLSDDRMNIIESKFNQEILEEVVPALVTEGRKYLVSTDSSGNKKFGRYLDALPARGREVRSWADEVINEPIYRSLRAVRSLPDADGEWRSPQQVVSIPDVAKELTDEWLESANRRDHWIHPDCTSSPERRSKALRLQNRDPKDSEPEGLITKWLEDVLEGDDTNPARSIAAIKLAEKLAGTLKVDSDHIAQATKARVVLLEDHTLVAPRPGNCFIRSDADQSGNAFVHKDVSAAPSSLAALENLGITRYEDNGDLYAFLRKLRSTTRIDWDEGWSLMRGAPFEDLNRAINEILGSRFLAVFKVRNGLEEWVSPTGLFRPGRVFSPVKEDGRYLIDHVYHAADKAILEKLGVHDSPRFGYPCLEERWAKSYKDAMYQDLSPVIGIPEVRKPQLEYKSDDMRIGPLGSLPELSQTNKVNLTNFILNRAHTTAQVWYQGRDERRKVISPELWIVKEHGLLETSLGAYPASECFFLRDTSEDISRIVPVVEDLDIGSEAASLLGSRTTIDELSVENFRLLPIMHRQKDNESAVAESYSWWCYQYPDSIPETMVVKLGEEWIERAPEEIAVTSDPVMEIEMESLGFPSLTVPAPDDAEILAKNWGIQEAHTIPKQTLFSPAAEPIALGFIFPALEDEDIVDFEALQLQACESLAIESSMPGQPSVQKEVKFSRDGDTLYTVANSAQEKLTHVMQILELDSSKEAVEALLHSSEARKNNELRLELKKIDSDVERLLKFAGEERLLALIPQAAIDYIERYSGSVPSGITLAQTCVEMHGSAALEKVCKINGADLPIAPPPTWSGSHPARKWVKDLGFDEAWAGMKPVRRATPTEYVGGPAHIALLHDYQQQVSDRLHAMLSADGLNRGLINLPTGAGKTRVAVQTIIEAIAQGDLDYLTNDEFTGPILWLVDSEELCEQAIEAWSYLWRAKGRANTQLILSRHFDAYSAEEETAGVQVVVGTYQKTVRSIDNPDYDWLKETPLVIIDEAHGAISASYTQILEWTGRTPWKRDKLLLGLSATPFRGREESDETHRLHRRFDDNFLAEGVFGDSKPLTWLQQQNVLSQVSMQVIQSERPMLHLTESEKKDFEEKHWLPKEREHELGQQSDRTRQIVESIKSQPANWSILVFATSVSNAQTLATLLTLEGIPAAAIDSNTPDAERRLALERFKSGKLRVLTNYAVLSQGFDAPKTRAVYITRPVQSAVRYQQMIGRGLRGPRNGGTEEVLIVNLLDNIESFESSISYRDFEYLAGGQVVSG